MGVGDGGGGDGGEVGEDSLEVQNVLVLSFVLVLALLANLVAFPVILFRLTTFLWNTDFPMNPHVRWFGWSVVLSVCHNFL